MKFWGIYDKNGISKATVEANSEGNALQKYAKENKIPDNELDGYWAEELDA